MEARWGARARGGRVGGWCVVGCRLDGAVEWGVGVRVLGQTLLNKYTVPVFC